MDKIIGDCEGNIIKIGGGCPDYIGILRYGQIVATTFEVSIIPASGNELNNPNDLPLLKITTKYSARDGIVSDNIQEVYEISDLKPPYPDIVNWDIFVKSIEPEIARHINEMF